MGAIKWPISEHSANHDPSSGVILIISTPEISFDKEGAVHPCIEPAIKFPKQTAKTERNNSEQEQ